MMKVNKNPFVRALVTTFCIILIAFIDLSNNHYIREKITDKKIVYIGMCESFLKRNYEIDIVDTVPEDADYVMVDSGYSFNGMNNYEKVGSYEAPLIVAAKNFKLLDEGSEVTLRKIINTLLSDGTWATAGLKDVSLDKISICIPYDTMYIGSVITDVFWKSYREIIWESDAVRTTKNAQIAIIFEPNLINMPEFQPLNIESFQYSLVFDVYRKDSLDNDETFQLKYMNEVNDDFNSKIVQDINHDEEAYLVERHDIVAYIVLIFLCCNWTLFSWLFKNT